MRRIAVLAALLLAACARPQPEAGGPSAEMKVPPIATELPAGRYVIDKSHTSITFKVDHLGFSFYTARFTNADATLDIDPANPAAASLIATIEAASLETDYPDPQALDFDAMLAGPDWLDASAHPEMTFRSTAVAMTGGDTARVTGDFTMRGVTKPLVLDVRFNGGYEGFPELDPQARIGFSASGRLKRTDYGMNVGVMTEEQPMGVGDEVEIIIETELLGPPLAETTSE